MIFILLCLLFTWEHKTMNLNVCILVFIIIKSTKCSIVHEELDQESIHMSKYCPKQKYCEEGTHVVCMYYDQNQKFGVRCGNPVKIEMTPKMIQNILANVNDIRGKVATGTEKGKDDEVLPRAYGLMKLEWDKELAFLAQVLANQCLGGREDNCRSTEKFPNPSQTIAVIRYKYPHWEYLQPNNTEKGLNEGKLLFALDRFLKTTHALKRTVTKDIIMKCPAYQELPNVNLKYYLNLVRGGATHIGCGVSAYSKYKMDGDSESMQNNVQIVCNISDAPKIKQAVYKVIPPASGQGYSKRCGCPRGYKESRSCLCERDLEYQWKGNIQPENNIEKKKKGLKHQLLDEYEERASKDTNYQQHGEDNDAEVNDDIMKFIEQSQHLIKHESQENKDNHPNEIELQYNIPKSHNDIRGNDKSQHRAAEEKGEDFEFSDEFSKMTNAISPRNNNHKNTRFPQERVLMFTSNHESKPQAHKPISKPAIAADAVDEIIMSVKSYGGKETTERAKDLIHDQHINEKAPDVKPQNNDRYSKHKRLLSILNSLEQEVNNIKFDNDLHKLFDLKMRKIYDKGLKKAKETPILRTSDTQLDEEDLHELRTYLENDNNASVEDEIATLRGMIHQLSRGKQKENIVNYAENENNPDQNYNNMDQQFDEFHDIKDMKALYEDILRKTELADHQNHHVQFLDIMNRRQNNNNNNLHEHPKTRNQQTLDNNNVVRQNILSRADYNLNNNYDVNKYERKGSFKDKKRIDESIKRTFGARVQFSQPFSRRNEYDDLHQMLRQRPNLLGTLKLYRNQPRQSIYPIGRDSIVTY